MTLDAPSWLVDFLETVSVWDALIWIAALAAAGWFLKAKGWRTIIAVARGLINAAEILAAVQGLPAFIDRTDERYARLEEKVDAIHHETHNNDGSSIKDSVDRIELGVKGLYPRVDVVEEKVAALGAADDEIRAELEDTRNPKENT